MNNEILIALITTGGAIFVGALSLIGVVIVNKKASRELSREIAHKLETHQAVTDTKIEELTREVREHNNFARRMPVVENEIEHIEHDIEDLKRFHERD